MATSLGSLTLKLIADLAGYTAPLEKAAAKTKSSTRGMQKQFEDVGSSIKRLAAAAGVGLAFKAIVDNTIEAEKAASQLNATLTATGRFTPELSAQMLAYSSALQQVSIFGDEAITASQTMLAGFTSIGGQVFQRAQQSILDVASALGKDLPDAARKVGLALEDPIKGIRLLRGLNVVLSASQQELIKDFEAVGDRASAQGVILDALDGKYQGAAAAARDTLGGALAALKESFGNLLEGDSSGPGGLADAINGLNTALNDPGVKSGIASLVAGMAGIAATAAKAAAAVVNVTNFLLDEQRARVFGPQLDDLVRLDEQAATARDTLEKLRKASAEHPGDRSFVEALTKATSDLAEKEQLLAAARKQSEIKASAGKGSAALPNVPAIAGASVVVDISSADAKRRAVAEKSLTAAIKAEDDARKKAADAIKAREDEAARRQEELASLYQTNIGLLTGLDSESQRYGETMAELNALLDAGAVSQADYIAAVDRLGVAFDGAAENVGAAGEKMNTFADQAARNLQDTFSAKLFDPFEGGLKGMISGFSDMLRQMAAQAVTADFLHAIGLGGPGNTGGNVGMMAKGIGGFFGGLFGSAHAGIDSVPETGTWLLKKRERVVDAKTSVKLDRTLDRVAQSRGGGAVVNVQNIVQGGSVETKQEKGPDGSIMIKNWFRAELKDAFASGSMDKIMAPMGARRRGF